MQIIRSVDDGIVSEITYNELGLPIKYTNVSSQYMSNININDIDYYGLFGFGIDDDNTNITVDYKYDEHKNWIYKQINSDNVFDGETIIVERTINYK